MLTYHAAFWTEGSTVLARIVDFPGVVAYGASIGEARAHLSAALVDMAETSLPEGEALPLPDPSSTDDSAELVEPIHLILSAGNQLSIQVCAA